MLLVAATVLVGSTLEAPGMLQAKMAAMSARQKTVKIDLFLPIVTPFPLS
jgi:hypothetical protein